MNTPIANHPLVGHKFVYRPDLPKYDPKADGAPGRLVCGNGHTVTVRAVFSDWNDVSGLTMFYVLCHETGMSLHLSPCEINPNWKES